MLFSWEMLSVLVSHVFPGMPLTEVKLRIGGIGPDWGMSIRPGNCVSVGYARSSRTPK